MLLSQKRVIGTVAPMIGLPSLLTDFFWSYAQMVEFNSQYVCGPDERIAQIRPNHSYHTISRNELSKVFTGDWLLMLDTDHKFEPDILFRLLNVMYSCRAEVVTGLYLHKHPPYNPTLWRFPPEGGHQPLVGWPDGEIMEVGSAGCGCLLIHRWVFDQIYGKLGEEPFSTVEFDRQGGTTGEDFAFFRRLQRLGIKAVCPTYIECNHLLIKPLEYARDCDQTCTNTREVPNQKVLARAEN